MGARGSLQTYPPQDRPLTTLKELRPFVVYKASHESALTPFRDLHKVRGPGTKLQQTERRGRVCEDSLGLARDADKGSEAWLARRGG